MKRGTQELREFRIDMTYDFQEHGIVIAKDQDGVGDNLDCEQAGDEVLNSMLGVCGGRCRFYRQCAKHQDISWTGLRWSRVQEVFPQELKFDKIIGAYSGQYSIDEMFKTWDLSYSMEAYGFSQKAALCLKHTEDFVSWCSVEMKGQLAQEDIRCMRRLADLLEECLRRPAYLCSNGNNPYLIPLSTIWRN